MVGRMSVSTRTNYSSTPRHSEAGYWSTAGKRNIDQRSIKERKSHDGQTKGTGEEEAVEGVPDSGRARSGNTCSEFQGHEHWRLHENGCNAAGEERRRNDDEENPESLKSRFWDKERKGSDQKRQFNFACNYREPPAGTSEKRR